MKESGLWSTVWRKVLKRCHVGNTEATSSTLFPTPLLLSFLTKPQLCSDNSSLSYRMQGKVKPFPVPRLDMNGLKPGMLMHIFCTAMPALSGLKSINIHKQYDT